MSSSISERDILASFSGTTRLPGSLLLRSVVGIPREPVFHRRFVPRGRCGLRSGAARCKTEAYHQKNQNHTCLQCAHIHYLPPLNTGAQTPRSAFFLVFFCNHGNGFFQQFKPLFRFLLPEIKGREYPDHISLGEIDEKPEFEAFIENRGGHLWIADFHGQEQPLAPDGPEDRRVSPSGRISMRRERSLARAGE